MEIVITKTEPTAKLPGIMQDGESSSASASVSKSASSSSPEASIDVDIAEAEATNAAVLEASRKRKRPTAALLKDAMEELDRIWCGDVDGDPMDNNNDNDDDENNENNNNNNNRNIHDLRELLPPSELDRIRQTTDLLVRVFQKDLHEPAIRALVENEKLVETQSRLENELAMQQKEVQRLRRSEQRSKESIQNLLKAVGQSAEETKDATQTKLVEAKMRADLLQARSERNSSHKDSMISKRSVDRLKEEVETLRKDKIKLQDDKARLERDVQSARTLADSLSKLGGSSNNEDLDVQKHKVKELEMQLEAMKARLAEMSKELQELQLYRDRNESKQRLEALKGTGKGDSSSNSANKRPRRLYSIK